MRPTIDPTLMYTNLKPRVAAPPIVPDRIIIINTPPTRREVVARFLTLPHHKRENVLKALDLVVWGGDDVERYIEAFRTIDTSAKFAALVREIEGAEKP